MRYCTRRFCVRPVPVGAGDGWCPQCRAERRDEWAALLAAGVCPRCGQHDRAPGRAACAVCLDRAATRERERRSLIRRAPARARRVGGLR